MESITANLPYSPLINSGRELVPLHVYSARKRRETKRVLNVNLPARARNAAVEKFILAIKLHLAAADTR